MEEKRITISDIADELGLSTATVSNVIHGKTSKVSEKTIQKVQEQLEKRNYIPSMAGILLAQNDSGIIGVVVNRHEKYEMHVLEDNFISSMLNYLSMEIEKSGKFMMIKTTDNSDEIVKYASMWNMEGLILIGFCENDYNLLRKNMRIPFVAFDVNISNPMRIGIVNIDNYGGGFLMGRHLKSLNHENALCIADNEVFIDRERFEGFRDGFSDGNVDFMLIPMKKAERKAFFERKFSFICEHSAIFAVSDYYSVEIMQFLISKGISVPAQISVAGFDDTPVCTQVFPTLTTISQDVSLRAKTALNKLFELKENENAGEVITLPLNLINRESTDYVRK